jgi:inner membrane protein
MPTILTHPVVPLAIAAGLGSKVIPTRLIVAGVVAAILPDLDVLAFKLGIPYSHDFGHRGFSHSILFALAFALVIASMWRWLDTSFWRALLFIFIAGVSHGLLDAFTNGGLGIAFLWPWSGERYFAPYQVIQVSPIGVSRFISAGGLAVLWSEFLWVWLPFMGLASVLIAWRRYQKER